MQSYTSIASPLYFLGLGGKCSIINNINKLLNLNTRYSKGTHYASIEKIHEVTEPLFIGALREFEEISVLRTLKNRLEQFQDKLSLLTFIAPVCGSGILNPETRYSEGTHYALIGNIHKVTEPLFISALRPEPIEVEEISVLRTRKNRIEQFQDKLASLTFLDPACGSRNFLTETFLSFQRLENEVIRQRIATDWNEVAGQIVFGLDETQYSIKVPIGQFYGTEINDFAVTIAKTALWISKEQMIQETKDILHSKIDFLLLKSYANIICGNALLMDWETVVLKATLRYIMGNPPFVGTKYMSFSKKKEMCNSFGNLKDAGELEYVCACYKLSANYMQNSIIRGAYVSTNSITQVEQVPIFWKYLLAEYWMLCAILSITGSISKDSFRKLCLSLKIQTDKFTHYFQQKCFR